MTVVRFTPADVRALDRALLTMEAERAAAEKWGIANIEAEEAQKTLVELRDRMLAEQAEVAGVVMFPRVPPVDMVSVKRLERLASRDAS